MISSVREVIDIVATRVIYRGKGGWGEGRHRRRSSHFFLVIIGSIIFSVAGRYRQNWAGGARLTRGVRGEGVVQLYLSRYATIG